MLYIYTYVTRIQQVVRTQYICIILVLFAIVAKWLRYDRSHVSKALQEMSLMVDESTLSLDFKLYYIKYTKNFFLMLYNFTHLKLNKF